MNPDESAARAFARLTETLSEEILDTSDADLAGIFPGRSGGMAADAWRQMVRRIVVSAESTGAPPAAPLPHPMIDRDREEDTP